MKKVLAQATKRIQTAALKMKDLSDFEKDEFDELECEKVAAGLQKLGIKISALEYYNQISGSGVLDDRMYKKTSGLLKKAFGELWDEIDDSPYWETLIRSVAFNKSQPPGVKPTWIKKARALIKKNMGK